MTKLYGQFTKYIKCLLTTFSYLALTHTSQHHVFQKLHGELEKYMTKSGGKSQKVSAAELNITAK